MVSISCGAGKVICCGTNLGESMRRGLFTDAAWSLPGEVTVPARCAELLVRDQ